jgi:hypothetical protein
MEDERTHGRMGIGLSEAAKMEAGIDTHTFAEQKVIQYTKCNILYIYAA